jgi:membrane-bound inhibitor of C-type lysozyme
MRFAPALIAVAILAGCADKPSKEEEEAAKNTMVCQLEGERVVIRFDTGEARMLLPGGDRVILYQVPSQTGARFSNGNLELRGKGTEFTLVDHTAAAQAPLVGCAPYSIPKETK